MKRIFTLVLAIMPFASNAQLMISELCDPQNNYQNDRYVEIYNPTGCTIDLTGWTVQAISNNSTCHTWTLSGTIAPGDALVCGSTTASITVDFASGGQWAYSTGNCVYNWNGQYRDGARLMQGATVIDYVLRGSTSSSYYANRTMVRNSSVCQPSTTFILSQWTITNTANAGSGASTPGSHTGSAYCGGTAGLWTGANSTDWFDCGNWDNLTVPTAGTNVTINQTASNNCVVGGSGSAVCNNLTISSNNGTTNDLTIQNTASLTCGGDVLISKTAGGGNLTISMANTASFSCDNLTITGTASGSENAQFENEINTTTVTINGNLTINNGGVFDLTDNPNYGTASITGNWTNNGLETDFKQTNSIVTFNGTGLQTINTNGFNEVFANIVVNKSSNALTLLDPIEVENNVTFTNGVVNSTGTNLLIFRNNATVSAMSNNSFVDGPVRKIGNDAFTFPTGDDGNYQPISISAPSNTSHHFTAQYFEVDPHPTYDENSRDISLHHISSCEYWTLDRTNGASNVTVTLSWDANSCGVTNLSNLRVARWDGAVWRDHGNGGTTGNTTAGTVVTSANVTAFSPFTLASVNSDNPLPVELISFKGNCNDSGREINWQTATETNNAYFTLERSPNGYTYDIIKTIPGAGNSNMVQAYSFVDPEKLSEPVYYRLSQTDYDGTSEVFEPIVVTCSQNDNTYDLSLNSAGQTHTTFLLSLPGDEFLQMEVVDALGRVMHLDQAQFTSGVQMLTISTSGWAAGIYTLRLVGIQNQQTIKFFVK